MNNKMLLLLIIIVFSLTINVALTESQPSLIIVEHEVSPETIFVKGSGHPDSSTVTLKVTGTNSIPRKNVDAVLVIDTSNSMIGAHLSAAKNASRKFIARMDRSKDKIGFVSFNSTIGPNITLTNEFNRVYNTINATDSTREDRRGITCLSVGLNKAIEMLGSEEGASFKTIIILSDGNNRTCKDDKPCDDAVRARNLGITIFAVGINDSGKGTEYLKCIAETTGGRYYPAEDGGLEKIYDNLSRNIANIISNNVILNYDASEDTEIDNIRPSWFVKKNNDSNSVSGSIGPISINETKTISFDIKSRKATKLYLATGNNSGITFIGYDGKKYYSNISMKLIEVIETSDPDTNIVATKMPQLYAVPFQFQAQGSDISRKSTNTNMTISKAITSGSSGPHITLKLAAPGIEEIKTNVVIAVDSSGSLGMGGRAEYGRNVRKSIPIILAEIEYMTPLSSVSIISWDNDIDFAYPPLSNRNISTAEMVPISSAKREIDDMKIFGSNPSRIDSIIGLFVSRDPASKGEYTCYENESTDLSIGLDSAREVLNKTVRDRLDGTLKLILLITARSEFAGCNDTLILKAKNENCDIHTVGIAVIRDSLLHQNLTKIAGDKTDISPENKLGSNKTKYHYSPGSLLFNKATVSTAVGDALQQFFKENISNNIVVVDTLHSYVRVDNESIITTMNKKILNKDQVNVTLQINPDNTTTLQFIFNKNLSMKPSDLIQISFDTRLDLSLPIETTISRSSKSDSIGPSTPTSYVSYDWLGNGKRYKIPLPESNIIIN